MLYIVDWVKIQWIRRPHCWRNESSTFRSRKAMVSSARCAVERQKPTLGYPEYVLCSSFWVRRLSR